MNRTAVFRIVLVCIAGLSALTPLAGQDVWSHPDPSRPLAERIDAALQRRPDTGTAWVAWGFTRWQAPHEGWWIRPGRTLHFLGRTTGGAATLAERLPGVPVMPEAGPRDRWDDAVEERVAAATIVLVRLPESGRPDQVSAVSAHLSLDATPRPLLWLGMADAGESVAWLGTLLDGSLADEGVSAVLGTVALHPLPDRVIPVLTRYLRSDIDAGIRRRAAEALGWQNDPRSVPPLVAAMETDASDAVRRAAAGALARLDVPAALPPLLAAARKAADDRVRARAVEGLARHRGEAVDAVLERALWEDASRRVRHAALEVLASSDTEADLARLERVFRDHPDRSVRSEALELLAVRAADRAVRLMDAAVIDSEDLSLQRAALDALAEMGGDAGVSRIITISRTHPVPAVRRHAIHLLGELDDPRAHAALLELIHAGQ